MTERPWIQGPWSYSHGSLIRIHKPQHKPITIAGAHRIGVQTGRGDPAVPLANARLIAAAPEMFELLDEVAEVMAWVDKDTEDEGEDTTGSWSKRWIALRARILPDENGEG